MAAEQLPAICCAVLVLSASCSGFLNNHTGGHSDSLADSSLLLTRYATSEEVFHQQKRSFPMSTKKGEAKETGFYNVGNLNNALYGTIFGHLVLEDASKRGDVYYKCEGVLIGPRHVLIPLKDCSPKDAGIATYRDFKGQQKYHEKKVEDGEGIVFLYTKVTGNTGTRHGVKVESIWKKQNSKYAIALLATNNDLSNIEFPIVSWLNQNALDDYQLCLEMAKDYPVLLSTPTVTQALKDPKKFEYNGELSKVLSNAEFRDCQRYVNVITLAKKGLPRQVGDVDISVGVPGIAKPLSGAAFFKLLDQTGAVVGIKSDSMTGECEIRPQKRKAPGNPPAKNLADTFQCGHRFDWNDAKGIYELGMAVDPTMPRGNDVIPKSETVIGSWNFQHLTNMDKTRALSTNVYETLLKVIEKTSILALQEVENFDQRVKGKTSSLQLLSQKTELDYVAEGEYAFVFRKNTVQLIDQCRLLVEGGHKYAYQCQFKFNGLSECFTVYSAHFRAGDDKDSAKVRDNEFSHFSNHAKGVKIQNGGKNCGRVQILAGDFNTKDAAEVRNVAHYFIDFRFLQAGPTKPSSGRSFDHILVSETVRLPHRYIWPGRDISRGPITRQWEELKEPYAKEFYPRDASAALRRLEPTYRSSDLSDHLPVQMEWNGLKIGTWNIIKSRQPGSLGVPQPLQQVYTDVLSLFSVLAVQELTIVPRSGTYRREWEVSSSLRKDGERLGFAYDSSVVTKIECEELDLNGYVNQDERRGYGCIFEKKSDKSKISIVNLHLLNGNNHNRNSVSDLLGKIRNVQKWQQSYIMGDFNSADLEKKWTGQDISRRCTHSRDLNDLAQPWTFTRLPSKLTLDYIFTPDPGAVGSHVPGQAGCKVIHPELETNGGILLIPDDPQKRVLYSFIGSWDEISDHYPVFMQFEPLVEPLGATDEARRKRAGAEQIWP